MATGAAKIPLPAGYWPFLGFLLAAAAVAALAALTMIWPDSAITGIWVVKEAAFRRLLAGGPAVPVGFSMLTATLVVAALGWWRRRIWGWGFSVGILAVNLAGDGAVAIGARMWGDGVGALVEAAILGWLFSPAVRRVFRHPFGT